MSIRTTSSTVRFSRPFMLTGIGGEQPAGSYTVETDEELLQDVSVPAYRRISTLIRLPPRPDSTELARIVDLDPAELAAIVASDAKAASAASIYAAQASIDPQQKRDAARQSPGGWKAGWHAWLALNANELTWMALLAGGILFASLFADR
jgi:hypothetical protein